MRKPPRDPISLDKIGEITEMTNNNYFRPEIARKVGASVSTVYKYQRLFGLV